MKKVPFKENPFMLYGTFKRQDNSQIFDILIYSTELLSTLIYPILCKKESWDMYLHHLDLCVFRVCLWF